MQRQPFYLYKLATADISQLCEGTSTESLMKLKQCHESPAELIPRSVSCPSEMNRQLDGSDHTLNSSDGSREIYGDLSVVSTVNEWFRGTSNDASSCTVKELDMTIREQDTKDLDELLNQLENTHVSNDGCGTPSPPPNTPPLKSWVRKKHKPQHRSPIINRRVCSIVKPPRYSGDGLFGLRMDSELASSRNTELTASLTSRESSLDDDDCEWTPRGVDFLGTTEVCIIRK